MRALTLWQPYASLIAIGAKTIETRGWATDYRGPLAIHAAAREPRREEVTEEIAAAFGWDCPPLYAQVDALPLGAVVATCTLVTCYRVNSVEAERIADGEEVLLQLARGERVPVTRNEAAFGNFGPYRIAWVLSNVKALPSPVLAKGGQGLWTWKERAA